MWWISGLLLDLIPEMDWKHQYVWGIERRASIHSSRTLTVRFHSPDLDECSVLKSDIQYTSEPRVSSVRELSSFTLPPSLAKATFHIHLFGSLYEKENSPSSWSFKTIQERARTGVCLFIPDSYPKECCCDSFIHSYRSTSSRIARWCNFVSPAYHILGAKAITGDIGASCTSCGLGKYRYWVMLRSVAYERHQRHDT